MGKGIPWLEFVSPRERKRREEQYYRRMFPFGEEQRRLEGRLLSRCTDTKLSEEELLFQLLCVREVLQEEDEMSRKDALESWRKNPLTANLSPADRQVVYALAVLSAGCSSLEEYPDEKRLRAEAEKIDLK
ncbi:MAG: hypothetical protein LUE86_11455 [Clostridiales bacterium]|nr:hypothetical protein [Clostridiales bacterium]